jgi:hypothetical protein
MVCRSSLVLLIPVDPTINGRGPGSCLVFRSAMYHLKAVFVAALDPTPESVQKTSSFRPLIVSPPSETIAVRTRGNLRSVVLGVSCLSSCLRCYNYKI